MEDKKAQGSWLTFKDNLIRVRVGYSNVQKATQIWQKTSMDEQENLDCR